MPEKELVTWKDVEDFVNQVAFELSNDPDFICSGVYGLPRGGLVLAVMLSHKLHVPMLMSPAQDCLIVDDICDSGESLLHYVKNTSGLPADLRAYRIATMYFKENKFGILPDYFLKEKGDKWIVFPWEMEE